MSRIFAVACAIGMLVSASANARGAPAAENEAHSILRDLLAIDTTYERGTVAAVNMLRARFLSAGFSNDDLLIVADPDHPDQANLIVHYHGRGLTEPLLYLCHLDVVAAKAEDWSMPPFQLTEKEGWIYGRGSLDMKGEDANVAAALIRLKREGYIPARDITVAFTADEEAGGEEGVGWLLRTHPDLVKPDWC